MTDNMDKEWYCDTEFINKGGVLFVSVQIKPAKVNKILVWHGKSIHLHLDEWFYIMGERKKRNYVWSNATDKILFKNNDDLQPRSGGRLQSLKEATKHIEALGGAIGK